jgi:transcriptional regulator with XRE-family HTH domain
MTTQAHYIREWRKKRGLTQGALADAMAVDRTLVNKVETGAHRYNQDFLEGAATVLGCSTAELLVRNPADTYGFWAEYDRLSATEQERVRDFVLGLRAAR